MKDWLTYLGRHGIDWRSTTLEDVAGFVAWFRMQPPARDGRVTMQPYSAARSVNRKLAALTSFCSYKPFLHHVSKGGGERRRTIKLKTSRQIPKVLTVQQFQSILDSCEHLRDRLLFALMLDTGVRVGEALGCVTKTSPGAEVRDVVVLPGLHGR
ncbi:hypothetical protein [Rhodococcus koreensis]|uniref:hypothetical protein n=1 Tax=Rhodococcus koreensis TaxID=99653 RepID=UPI00367063F9